MSAWRARSSQLYGRVGLASDPVKAQWVQFYDRRRWLGTFTWTSPPWVFEEEVVVKQDCVLRPDAMESVQLAGVMMTGTRGQDRGRMSLMAINYVPTVVKAVPQMRRTCAADA